jgi:ketosteroid isomerase-like protein
MRPSAREILGGVSEDNVEAAKSIFGPWGRGDFSAVDWADPEIEFVIPGPDPRVYRGVAEMAGAWAEWLRAWTGFAVEARRFHDFGDRVVVDQAFHGSGRGSGIPVDQIAGAAVLTFRDGKVISFEGFTNTEAALASLGTEP